MRKLSGIGLVIFGLTVTFAAFDWIMSIEPKWYSTIYGSLVMVSAGHQRAVPDGAGAASAARRGSRWPLREGRRQQQFHDIGNFMFAFTILWAYMSASQYIIIWSSNLPEEIEYYLHRGHGCWPLVRRRDGGAPVRRSVPGPVASRANKKPLRRAGAVLRPICWCMRPVDLLLARSPRYSGTITFYAALAGCRGAGGPVRVWMVAFLRQLGARPLVPQNDPRFKHMLTHPEEHDEGWESDASNA
jgi:hypothetical protein